MVVGISVRSALAVLAASASACGRLGFDELTGDAGSVTSACADRTFSTPALSSLVDDFAGTTIASPWFVPAGGQCVTQSDGSLFSDLVADNDNEYCVAYAQGSWHLTCDSITVEVAQVPRQVLGAQTVLYLDESDSTNALSVILEGSSLQWTVEQDAYFPYDSTADRWWRVRENDGELYFDTSPDGTTFTTLTSGPDPASLDAIHPDIGAGTYKAVANPGSAAFRCFNVPAPCQ